MVYATPNVPSLKPERLPADEQESGGAIFTALILLQVYTTEIASAVDLFQQSGILMRDDSLDEMLRGREWRFLAARAGAIAIYNFAEALNGARNNLHLCPTWERRVDMIGMKAIIKRFNDFFPFTASVRHSVGHEAEFMTKLKELSKHRLPGGAIKMKWLVEDEYHTTYKGQVLVYRVNDVTAKAVYQTAWDFVGLFFHLQ